MLCGTHTLLLGQDQSYILHNGTMITPSATTFTNPPRGMAYFNFDNQYIVEVPSVKYIEYDTVRYRITGMFKGNIQYLKRIKNGPRIDIYLKEYKKTGLSPFKNSITNKTEFFFEKDEGPTKTITYNHVKWAVIDDPVSHAHLKTANKFRWIQLISVSLGAYAAITAIQQEDFRSPISLVSVSLLSLIPVTLAQKPKQKILYEAIDLYNQPR